LIEDLFSQLLMSVHFVGKENHSQTVTKRELSATIWNS